MTPERRRWLVAITLLVAFRIAVVVSYHAPAGDGLQYYRLAEELRRHHRYAFAPPPVPPSYTRVPGYPLFLAYVVGPLGHLPLEWHLVLAAIWNVLLDLGSALFVAATLRARGHARAGACAFALVMIFPLMVFLSCYGLTESLATFLATAELYCIVRAMKDRPVRHAALAGACAGLAQLVRVDAVAMLPPVGLALLLTEAPLGTRARALGAFALAAALVFSPWPIRNQLRFGAPHPEGTSWLKQDGSPQLHQMQRWFATWSTASPGEAYLQLLVANEAPIDPNRPGILRPVMYDDEAEHQRVLALIGEYNRGGLTPEVDRAFGQLADERARRAPLRTFVWLPLRRLWSEWQPMPEYELPVRTALLGLPRLRATYGHLEWLIFAFALAGGVLLWRHGEARLVLVIACAVAVRGLLPAVYHPFPVERYLVEAYPALLVLAGFALGSVGRRAAAGS
jgi:4-amino-4-deoxy-L-arabinose transferase-like glycosyltransferase